MGAKGRRSLHAGGAGLEDRRDRQRGSRRRRRASRSGHRPLLERRGPLPEPRDELRGSRPARGARGPRGGGRRRVDRGGLRLHDASGGGMLAVRRRAEGGRGGRAFPAPRSPPCPRGARRGRLEGRHEQAHPSHVARPRDQRAARHRPRGGDGGGMRPDRATDRGRRPDPARGAEGRGHGSLGNLRPLVSLARRGRPPRPPRPFGPRRLRNLRRPVPRERGQGSTPAEGPAGQARPAVDVPPPRKEAIRRGPRQSGFSHRG